jgi:hypothetical protein
MKLIEDKSIITDFTQEESASFSGGGPISYLIYMQLARTPASPGGIRITAGEIHHGWNILINAAPPVNGVISP